MPDATTAATQNNNGAAQSLMTGAVAIYQDGQWACLDFDGMDFNWGVAVMPVGPDADEGAPYTYFSSSPMCIFKSTEHLEETWDFYMWLCNPDEAIELYSNGLWQPVLRSWYEDEELLAKWTQTDARPSGYMDAVVDMTVNHILPLEASYINNFDQMDAIIESSLEPLWLGTASAEQAVANIDVSAYLDGSRTAIGPQS
jgi:multiple sugar transport system substrate-binding protein